MATIDSKELERVLVFAGEAQQRLRDLASQLEYLSHGIDDDSPESQRLRLVMDALASVEMAKTALRFAVKE